MVANPHFYQTAVLHPLVLIVEADEDTRLMMKYLLQMWGYSVIEAAHAEAALEMIKEEEPDAILFCGKVQTEADFAVVKEMRELSSAAEPVIIFISAFPEPPVRAAALNAGADSFLVKPIDFGHLEQMLEQNLRQKFLKNQTL